MKQLKIGTAKFFYKILDTCVVYFAACIAHTESSTCHVEMYVEIGQRAAGAVCLRSHCKVILLYTFINQCFS